MLKRKNEMALIGSVGDDAWGKLYEELLQGAGIVPIFEKFSTDNTGMCSVFCNKKDRAHITDLGASTQVNLEFVELNLDWLKEVELIYTELFILKHRKNIVYLLGELAHKDRKIFGFNLPSFYFIETYLKEINDLWEYADVVFANEAEAMFYGSLNNIYVIVNKFRRII
jgi:sugar/nucleoside kinase (ribokinase family)